ncbi:hypothetical protein RI129_002883 [Pyrocoelia pectoralis]|uniref:Uncharacterized protein n=1 Tax=Pyrocoelia pectoralis TaxID=417401 RepID=A0AAN7ZTW8_9COLE
MFTNNFSRNKSVGTLFSLGACYAFVEMKSHIKCKIRASKELNATEKKCADILGLYTPCSCISSIPELGMASVVNDDNSQNPPQEQNEVPEIEICNAEPTHEDEGEDGREDLTIEHGPETRRKISKQKPKLAHSIKKPHRSSIKRMLILRGAMIIMKTPLKSYART